MTLDKEDAESAQHEERYKAMIAEISNNGGRYFCQLIRGYAANHTPKETWEWIQEQVLNDSSTPYDHNFTNHQIAE